MEENHYMKALFPSREGHFSLRWIRGIRAMRRKACVALRRDMSGSWACDALAHKIEGSTLGNSLILVYPSYHYWFTPCTNTALIVGYIGLKHHSIATHQTTSAILRPSSQDHPKSIVLFLSKTNQILVSLPWTSTKRLGIGLHLSRKSIPIY